MSSEKIDLTISIDGQKEFCESMTECCTNLTALVSEIEKADSEIVALDNSFSNFEDVSVSLNKMLEAGVQGLQTISSLSGAEKTFTSELNILISALEKQKEVIQAVTMVQNVLNSSMVANPVYLLIAGITTLGSIFVSYSQEARKATDETEKFQAALETISEGMAESEENVITYKAEFASAKQVINELVQLDNATEKTSNDYKRMKSLVTQLNVAYPEMGLKLDGVTNKLNMSSEEMRSYVGTLESMAGKEVYFQQMQSQMEKYSELEKNYILLRKENVSLLQTKGRISTEISAIEKETEKRMKLVAMSQEELNSALHEGSISQEEYNNAIQGIIDPYVQYNGEQRLATELITDLKQEQDSLQESLEANRSTMYEFKLKMEEAQSQTESYAQAYNELNEIKNASLSVVGEELAAYQNLSEEQQHLAVHVTDSVFTMQENVKNALQSQMQMFEHFGEVEEIKTSTILANMHSQVDGVIAWQENMASLMTQTKETSKRVMVEIDEGLIQYLASMGPEGAAYVQAFVNMSGDELAEANQLWQDKMDIEGFSNEAGQKMIQGMGALSAGGVEAFEQLASDLNMKANNAGGYSVQGFVDGILAAKETASQATTTLGQAAINGLNTSLDCHSPSKKAMESGVNTGLGLAEGIKNSVVWAKTEVILLGQAVVSTLENAGMRDKAYKVGTDFADGMKSGISSKVQEIADEAARMVRKAINAANAEQDSNSPAKETIKVGHNFGDGAIVGIEDRIPEAERASVKLIDTMLTAVSDKQKIVKESISASLDFSALSGKLKNMSTSAEARDLRNLGDYIIAGMKNIKLESYLDSKKISREFSRMGVSFHA